MPLAPDQADGVNHTSLAYEDKLLLRIRIERLRDRGGPFSQQPPSRCHHLLQAPEVERADPEANLFVTRTQFHYTEYRATSSRSMSAPRSTTSCSRTAGCGCG